jgi:UDP-2-acetamido-3-amino-2,3-dideoxy-glucuronate N-acetyltransferase
MIHEKAIVETDQIGEGTKIWANTHICKYARIGKECTIGENVFIGEGVVIGDRCRIQNGALIYSGVTIEDDVLIGPGVVTTNDYYPELPVGDWSERFKKTFIHSRASIGANATIICGVTIHQNSMVGAGSVVTKDLAAGTVVVGNPARKLKDKWKQS